MINLRWMLWVVFASTFALWPTQAKSAPHPSSLVQPSVPNDTTITNPQPRARIKKRRRKKGTVYLKIKVIYAHIRKKKYIDPKLKKDVPSLSKSFDFNAYKLLKTYKYRTKYRQAIIIPISYRFQIQISPHHYKSKQNRIAIRTTFLYRKRTASPGRPHSRFTQYGYIKLLLKNGSQVAFLGPSINYGRALITLHARHKP